ncbi:MAG: DUF6518 family protein [Dehalococcoidia bacterium]
MNVAGFLAPLLAGPALGLFAWQSDRAETTSTLNEVIRGLGNVPSPWLFLAFVTGALLVRPAWGAFGGATALTLAVATYYVAIRVSGDREGIPLQGAMTGWFAVALIAGPIFGCAGAFWRSGPNVLKPLAVGLLSGMLVGEVAYFAGDALRHGYWQWGDTHVYLALADLGVALALPLLLLRSFEQRLPAYVTAAVVGVVALVVMLWLDQLMLDLFNA